MPIRALSRRAGLALALVTATAGQAQAQSRGFPARFWASASIGYGSASATCDGCVPGPAAMATTGSLAVGVRVSPRVLAGLRVDGWSARYDAGRELLGSLTAMVRWYPVRSARRWYTMAGTGLSTYLSWRPSVYGLGWDVILGTGYDAWSALGFSVSPFLKVNVGEVGDLRSEGVAFVTGWRQRVIDAGLALTWSR